MEDLIKKPTEDTPEIRFISSGKLFIGGISMPEDPTEFFAPVLDWTRRFTTSFAGNSVEVEVALEYFNSTSAKRIFQALYMLESLHNNGKRVSIIWKFEPGDDLIRDKGNEIKSLLKIPFEVVQA
jgi:hypothetical protein